MSYRLLFMISLMGLFGCSDDKPQIDFTEPERSEYQKIQEDFKVPEYKWGYLNENGQLAVKDEFDDLREYNEGFAAVCKGGLWGYIDNQGVKAIPIRFRTVKTFSEGIGIAQDLLGKFHLFDEQGKVMLDSLDYDDLAPFKEGKSVVNYGNLFGYISPSGEEVIKPQYESARSFQDGLGMVEKNGKFGFIDHENNVVVPLEYEKVWYPVSNRIRFKKNNKYGFIDLQTKQVVVDNFSSATDFQNDFAVVNNGDNFLLLSKNGEQKMLPYNYVDTGGEGKWIYASDARFGFLHNNGEVLCLPQYDLLMRYREGRAGYAVNDAWGYLNEEGKVEIPPIYPLVWDYVNGYARIISRYGFGFIDPSGNEVFPPQYMEVRDFSEGMARIQVYR